MAFIRNCICTILCHISIYAGSSQTVFYPQRSSHELIGGAKDAAMLFQKAIGNSNFSVAQYSTMPATGIIFIYDSTISDNELCRVESNGLSYIKFTAAQDNGLQFGLYQYLDELGFRFYQPGTIWEVIPVLHSPYKPLNKTYSNQFKYRSWMISGGHRKWLMDNNPDYYWDTYSGENGHNWSLYQRRNGMKGAYSFHGHRGDIMGAIMPALQNNPCYVACYNGSRQANYSSVPDINKPAAIDLWANTIEQKYTQYKNIIFSNTTLYADISRNFNYANDYIGIEVSDGPQWGNSTDNNGCINPGYPSAADQNFTLANNTAQKINEIYPGKKVQLYAYSSHANVPAVAMPISSNIDIQVVSTAFQNETSSRGLLNRWYNRSANISEYHYLNIPQWSGETPMFYLSDLKNTMARLKQKNSQGIMWEASPAKFASLPFLWASNRTLLNNVPIDSSLREFANNMFGPAAEEIFRLLQQMSDENTITMGSFLQDNKYKIPLYLQILNDADIKTQNATPVIKQRIRELKAYLHYMVLYYDWVYDPHSMAQKEDKSAALCIYLAKINKLQLVNSYFLIIDIVNKYPANGPFYLAYNVFTGTSYLNGNLSLITDEKIDADFLSDLNSKAGIITNYKLKDPVSIAGTMVTNNMGPMETINVKIGYTNGMYYPNRTAFSIHAKNAGNFDLTYVPNFYMADKGQINFTVEAEEEGLILKDTTIYHGSPAGGFSVYLPSAGTYRLSVYSLYQSSVTLSIKPHNHIFYKNTAFLGNKTESYRDDLYSFPGYYYVPSGMERLYFSVNNGNLATTLQISNAFIFKDNKGNIVEPVRASNNDSTLFYLEIPHGQSGTFWQVSKMAEYNLCFANISNIQWFINRQKTGAALPGVSENIAIGPNPSHGIYIVSRGGTAIAADEMMIYNSLGMRIAYKQHASQVNISSQPAGIYLYKMRLDEHIYAGKLVKL